MVVPPVASPAFDSLPLSAQASKATIAATPPAVATPIPPLSAPTPASATAIASATTAPDAPSAVPVASAANTSASTSAANPQVVNVNVPSTSILTTSPPVAEAAPPAATAATTTTAAATTAVQTAAAAAAEAAAPSAQITMDRLLPVINKLHDIFQRCGLADPIDLPQIVVVGAQSSGKSSVLEAIVGFDFLPRGSGVVTRSPTLIQLNKLKPRNRDQQGLGASNSLTTAATSATATSATLNGSAVKGGGGAAPHPERWVEFLHAPDRVFVSDAEIQAEIMAETERVAGKNKQLSPNALIMKVFSEDVVDLTLIDLPGLTKVPVGDQPPDIEKLVRAMIHSYIEKPNTIILAVHPANTDLATSDALQMARRVDPHGERTLGVVTKLDLMDSGTNALDMLQGRVIPLRRGYVGVVNRSQAALESRTSIAAARAAERAFFQAHPVYAPHQAKMGSAYLAQTLSSILMEHIRTVLPTIRTSLATQLNDVRVQLAALGPALSGADDASATLLHLLTNYASSFSDAIDGRPRAPIATTELAGGARISYIFHDKFGRELANMDPFEGLGPEEIRTALRNATGHRTPLFIPEAAFEMLVKRQLHRFLRPSLACVDMVYDELTRLAEAVESTELARFHRLRVAVSESTLKLLRERKTPTIEMVQNLVEMEMSYVNTWHPDFVGGKKAIGAMIGQTFRGSPNASAGLPADGANGIDMPPGLAGVTGRERGVASSASAGVGAGGNSGTGSIGGGGGATGGNGRNAGEPDAWVEKNLLGQESYAMSSRASRRSSGRGLAGVTGSRGNASGVLAMGSHMGDDIRSTTTASTLGAQVRLSRNDLMTDEERNELEILRTLLHSYFNIVRKRMQDMVPKAIITFLVQKSKDRLQSTLVSKLYRPNSIDKLMVEGDETAQRRRDMRGIEILLEEALREVNEIRDIH